MKSPAEWDEKDLLSLIASQEKESLTLDYKACDALAQTDGKKNELSKDVSAFANSAGGALVYGVLENGNMPSALDHGFDPSIITKEWIEQVINSRIQRRIDGISINQIDLKTTRPGYVAYVIQIPQSMRAPHQAHDKRFYKRFNFESVPMEEYEVRDTSRRSDSPDLFIQFSALIAGQISQAGQEPSAHFLNIGASIWNEAPTPANHIVINIFIDERLAIQGRTGALRTSGKHTLTRNQQGFVCARLHMNHSVPDAMPIFQGVKFSLFSTPVKVLVSEPGEYLLGYELVAPSMTKRLEGAVLTWDGRTPALIHR